MSLTRDCICPMVLTRGRYKVEFKRASLYYSEQKMRSVHEIFVCGLIFGFLHISYILACNFSDQLPVSTKFDMRSDPGVARNYGKLLVEMVSIVPDGIVCFFVSYSYMDEIIATWNDSGILKVKIMFICCLLLIYQLGFNILVSFLCFSLL